MYTVHTHRYIYRYMYVHSHAELYMHTYIYTPHIYLRVAECGDREMVVGVGESRPAVEVDNFESSFNLSHPPERASSISLFLSSFSGATRLYSSFAWAFISAFEPLSFALRSRSRCDILLEFCHVRASRIYKTAETSTAIRNKCILNRVD